MDLIETVDLNDCHNCNETLIGMLNDEKLNEAYLLYIFRTALSGSPLYLLCIFPPEIICIIN